MLLLMASAAAISSAVFPLANNFSASSSVGSNDRWVIDVSTWTATPASGIRTAKKFAPQSDRETIAAASAVSCNWRVTAFGFGASVADLRGGPEDRMPTRDLFF